MLVSICYVSFASGVSESEKKNSNFSSIRDGIIDVEIYESHSARGRRINECTVYVYSLLYDDILLFVANHNSTTYTIPVVD